MEEAVVADIPDKDFDNLVAKVEPENYLDYMKEVVEVDRHLDMMEAFVVEQSRHYRLDFDTAAGKHFDHTVHSMDLTVDVDSICFNKEKIISSPLNRS